MKKRKRKVKNWGRSYHLNQSPLYKLKNKKKLAELLNLELSEIKDIVLKKDVYYKCYYNEDNRYIEEPILLMYEVHNKLASFFSRISTPSYMHFAKKSCSNITNANVHRDAKNVVTFDIKSYYHNVTEEKIRQFFLRQLECSLDVAYLLSQLCTYNGHIPTGSQVSVYLCNLANIKMFNELNNIAKSNSLNFTVFADDITISGKNAHQGVLNTMRKVLEKYNYEIKKEKTKIYKTNQTPIVTGIALNNNHTAKNKTLKDTRKISQKLQLEKSPIAVKELKDKLRGKVAYFDSINQPRPCFVDCYLR